MKVAVVLFGMLRNFEHTSHFIRKYVENSGTLKKINPDYQVDYFFYGYPNKLGVDNCSKKLKSLFNPKKFEIVEWSDDLKKKINDELGEISDLESKRIGNTSVYSCLSSHRCRNMSNSLRQSWCQENKVNHDIVISSRIDAFFFEEIGDEISLIDDNSVLIPNTWDFKCVHHDAMSDTLAIGNEKSMNKYFQSYRLIPKLVREKGYFFHPETLMGASVISSGLIRLESRRYVTFEYPFTWHDDIRLWENNWSKEQVEEIIGIKLEGIGPHHRLSY